MAVPIHCEPCGSWTTAESLASRFRSKDCVEAAAVRRHRRLSTGGMPSMTQSGVFSIFCKILGHSLWSLPGGNDMPDAMSTRQSLLVRLLDPRDQAAWTEFVEIYEPLIQRLARSRGLQRADADDLAQDVFR